MSIVLTWLGHGSWSMRIDKLQVLLDPFLDDNPAAPCKAADVEADYILVSHGHFDHTADAASIAQRTGATIVAIFEIAEWFRTKQKLANTLGMNLGGGVQLPFGRVTLTPALHSSQLPDGSYGGEPGGFLVEAAEKRIYFACDTALFSDMQLIGDKGIDLAVLPIGDLYTMSPEDSVRATQFIRPRQVAPAHYNTWPPIEQDADAWSRRISAETNAEPIVVQPGETITV